MRYHVPKDHHLPPINFGQQIETKCDSRIIVKTPAHSVTLRDTSMGGGAEACPDCTNVLKSSGIVMAYAGEVLPAQTAVQENQATA